ncbi:sensor histidine kinase [Fischerella thermalis]|uniref:sensor histidine kinase n=1 Tax=Fischerella thermalis TaxID=372787 RepID=UPI001F1D5671|nr:HAMP domain-containing sensor histidine kinase [Fischerella thermalis]
MHITPSRSREQDTAKNKFFHPTRGIFWAVQTRILFWYILSTTFIFIIFIPTFREVLYARVDTRVRRELTEKMETFKKLIYEKDTEVREEIGESRNIKVDEQLKPPSSHEELEDFFDAFLSRQLPEDDTHLIAFVNEKFYKSSPSARPDPLAKDSKLMRRWAKLTQPEQGERSVSDKTIENIIYITEPVKINGKTLGVFVVAHTTAGERGEVLDAVSVIVQLSSVVLIVALIFAWLVSGRILAPLRLLMVTTRSISESDLTQRLPVKGKGEIAELAITFNEMMDRLEAAFTSQRNFINDAGHELRTPITIIRGHLELMGDNPEEVQETVPLVLDELDRMSRFVEDLILLAKAERPDFLQLETVDLDSFTRELFLKAQALADRNWQLEGIGKGKIIVDRHRLTQAVMNLAQNATQHTLSTDTISLGSAINRGKVHFWVKDTGEGIAKADQQRIFGRFARATNSRRRSEGAGLGLSIVQAIAQAHYGSVKLRSRLGFGSTFTIVLPVEPPQ